MILIKITGNTYHWREKYKGLGFRWDNRERSWWKLETEAMINNTMEALREDVPPKIQITLTHTDMYGVPISEGSLVVKELAVKSADADRRVVDWLTEVRKHAITNGCLHDATHPAKSDDNRSPSKPKSERPVVDEGFF